MVLEASNHEYFWDNWKKGKSQKKIIKQERKKRHKEENVKFRIEKHNNQN